MRKRKWVMAAFATALIGAGMLFAACGGDDDSSSPGTKSDSKGETTAPAGDATAKSDAQSEPTKPKSDDGGSSVATGGDEKYVSDMCKAGSKMTAAFEKAMTEIFAGTGADDDDPDTDAMMAAFFSPFEDLVKDMEKAKPPKEIAGWHDQSLKQMKALVQDMKDGNFDESSLLYDDRAEFPELPANVEERFNKIAEKLPECEGLGMFGEE